MWDSCWGWGWGCSLHSPRLRLPLETMSAAVLSCPSTLTTLSEQKWGGEGEGGGGAQSQSSRPLAQDASWDASTALFRQVVQGALCTPLAPQSSVRLYCGFMDCLPTLASCLGQPCVLGLCHLQLLLSTEVQVSLGFFSCLLKSLTFFRPQYLHCGSGYQHNTSSTGQDCPPADILAVFGKHYCKLVAFLQTLDQQAPLDLGQNVCGGCWRTSVSRFNMTMQLLESRTCSGKVVIWESRGQLFFFRYKPRFQKWAKSRIICLWHIAFDPTPYCHVGRSKSSDPAVSREAWSRPSIDRSINQLLFIHVMCRVRSNCGGTCPDS